MPNYRYNSQEYMRRRVCGPMQASPAPNAPCPETACPVCRDTRTTYDELSGMPLAMAYVPWQEWQNIYEAEKGFHCGTIFEELNKPFCGIGGCQNVR